MGRLELALVMQAFGGVYRMVWAGKDLKDRLVLPSVLLAGMASTRRRWIVGSDTQPARWLSLHASVPGC